MIELQDWANRIFTRYKNAISSLCTEASQTYNPTPATFPFVFFNQNDNPEIASDLANNENATNTSIEITVFTSGTASLLQDAKKIIALGDTEMRKMGFIRIYGPQQITNVSDTNVCRVIVRYRRVIGSEDIIETQ